MFIVTGSAGFIGSALVWALNTRGETDIVLVDDVDHPEKERNIAGLTFTRRYGIQEFREALRNGVFNTADVQAVFHLGACSDTTETNWDYLFDNNVLYSQELIQWCVERDIPCVYASSAATYGDGSKGFSDDHDVFDALVPLNLYGKSKLDVDTWARDNGLFEKAVVGLRYFNVFGPNEMHKEHQRSMIAKQYGQAQERGYVELFKSYVPEYADGESDRDFLYVKDAVDATLFFWEQPELGGVYNVGTGEARTWNDLARAVFMALKKEPDIRYIPMPENLRAQYQYHTEADISKLRAAGYTRDWTPLEEAVREYVQEYLVPDKHLV